MLRRPVVLVGMMGAGKTAVGSELARRLHAPFADSDDEIERAANMTVAEIFARDGEPFFRAREAQVIARLLAGPVGVVSTGGGAWMQARNRETVGAAAVSVWLDADLDTLWHRVRGRAGRPLLQVDDPRGRLAALLDARRPVYRTAQICIPAGPNDTIDTTTARLIAALTEEGCVA